MLFFLIFATYETHRGNFHLKLKEICSPIVKNLAKWIERGNLKGKSEGRTPSKATIILSN